MNFDPLKKVGGLFNKSSNDSKEEDRKGTWDDSGYSASDEEAHRNDKYHAPSEMKQVFYVFMNQMKLFSKMKFVYIMIFVAIAMPVIVFGFHDRLVQMVGGMFGIPDDSANFMMVMCLSLLPLVLALFASILCGSELPNEYKFRTAYLNMPLPMPRWVFYIGKYLAGFILILAICLFAYGMAMITTSVYYGSQFMDLSIKCMLITIVAAFAYTATAYCIGSFMKRGSTIVPLVILFVVLPVIMIAGMEKLEWDFLQYLPSNLCECVLALLGASLAPSIGGFYIDNFDVTNLWINVIVGIVWGVAFLYIGNWKNDRREM